MSSFSPSVREQLSTIHQLRQHLLKTCADRYDSDMDAKFDAVLASIDAPNAANSSGDGLRNLMRDNALSQNYIAAMTGLLLVFVHEVARRSQEPEFSVLRQQVERLWKDMAMLHQQFFLVPLPGVAC